MLTVTNTVKPWAFILAPDKRIYQVTLGVPVGNHGGQVVKILADSIEIQEGDKQRLIVMKLKN